MADNANIAVKADERFLTFKSDGRFYALPASSVSEVARMPPLARVPQAPRSLLGLANLRGAVLPVASVPALLGREYMAVSHSSRLIVLEGESVALAVDEVTSLVRIASDKVRMAGADIASETGEHLRGVFDSGAHVTKILDVPELLRRGFARNAPRRPSLATLSEMAAKNESAVEIVYQRLVVFEVAGQDYALPLKIVREIISVPEDLTLMPGSDDAVRGVMPYRDGLLALLSLRRLLGLPKATSAREKVLVVAMGDVRIGLVADRTHAVLSVDPAHIEAAPPVLAARAGGETQINEIYRAGHGRLISILAPERLFREDVMQKLTLGSSTMRAKMQDDDWKQLDANNLRFLVSRLDNNDFALPVDAVEEVARVPDQITRLPKTPKFLEGVVNLRGEVLPVIDQRRRFEMKPATANSNRRLVVVRTEQHRAGLIVDSVSEVLRCSPNMIKPSPDLTGDALSIVHSVINLEESGKIVLLLDPSELLTRTERTLLDSLGKESRGKESRQTKS